MMTIVSPRWKQDGHYAQFVKRYRETGAALIDNDFAEAYEFCWKTLDYEQKRDRMKSLDLHACQYTAGPRFVPRPLKFLQTEWERPVKPCKKNESRYVPPTNREVLIAQCHNGLSDPDPEIRRWAAAKLQELMP